MPSASEEARHDRLREHGDAVGLPLLDWYYLGADG
jgi:hypothetical protein